GIAKTSVRLAHTHAGSFKGTLEYMAPEQFGHEQSSPATDIYQLGVLLYKLLLGKAPVAAANPADFMQKIISGELIRPTQQVASFPASIEQILLKALERDPAHRYSSAAKMAAAIEAQLPGTWKKGDAKLAELLEHLAGDRHSRQQALINGLLQGTALDAASGELLQRDSEQEEPEKFAVELATFEELRPSPPAATSESGQIPFASAVLLADPSSAIGSPLPVSPVMVQEPGKLSDSMPFASAILVSTAEKLPLGMEHIGEYRTEKALGGGSLADVYVCHDPALNRQVVIKILKPELVGYKLTVDRFLEAARAMCKIKSPHVVTVYHVDSEGDRPYLVMELLRGESLALRLLRSAVPATATLALLREVVSGLRVAQSSGTIHRDLKPTNLFVADDHVKLTDFGMGLLPPRVGAGPIDRIHAGTVHYLAPELLRGKLWTAQTDMYALGAILYEMLTGERLFVGGTPDDVVKAQLEAPPPKPSALRREVPAIFDELVLRLLAKDPGERFDDMAALDEALALVAKGATSLPPPKPKEKPKTKTKAKAKAKTKTEPTLEAKPEPVPEPKIESRHEPGRAATRDLLVAVKDSSRALSQPSARAEPRGSDIPTMIAEPFAVPEEPRPAGAPVPLDAATVIDIEKPAALVASAPEPTTAVAADEMATMAPAPVELPPANEFSVTERTPVWQPQPDKLSFLAAARARAMQALVAIKVALGKAAAAVGASVRRCGQWLRKRLDRALPVIRRSVERIAPWARSVYGRIAAGLGPAFRSAGAAIRSAWGRARAAFMKLPRGARIGIGVGSAALLVAVAAVVVVVATHKPDVRERLARGEYQPVADELAAIPAAQRTAEQELLRGHALRALKQDEEAAAAYAVAVKGGAVDDAVLVFMLARLDNRKADAEIEALAAWPEISIEPRLKEITDNAGWTPRHNALRILEKRGAGHLIDRQAFAIKDLLSTGTSCETRKAALKMLLAAARDGSALAAVRKAKERYSENSCMLGDLSSAEYRLATQPR
ncbi:MAG: protein kinase, partial [Deltaproteobacteria bacterium]|nr:protein kinase [Deltaproteobacteria bacterium]